MEKQFSGKRKFMCYTRASNMDTGSDVEEDKGEETMELE